MPLLLSGSLAAFTLWDFYLGSYGQGIRVFDIAAACALFAGLAVAEVVEFPRRISFTIRQPALVSIFLTLFLVAGVVGFTRAVSDARPTIAVWLGLLVFLVFHASELTAGGVRRVLDVILVVHVGALMLQMAAYYLTGELLNFQSVVGGVPRVFSVIFRPSGLFLEPGSYALTTMLLLLLRDRVARRMDVVTALALMSIFASLSLFGIIAVAGYLAYRYWRTPSFWIGMVAVALAVAANIGRLTALPQGLMIAERVASIGSDASVSARYGSLASVGESISIPWKLWVGRGVTNEYLQFGSSSIGFLLASAGILGAIVFAAIVTALAMRRDRVHVVLALTFGLVAAPIWTTFFWWAWLGLLTNSSLQSVADCHASSAVESIGQLTLAPKSASA